MGFKEIKSLDADVTIRIGGKDKKTNKANPTSVEGFYLGTRQVTSAKSKSGFASIHFFQTAKGNVGVWGKTNMDQKLKSATPGAMTRVKFEKMQNTPNGEMYVYSVAQDDENTIDVGDIATDSAAGVADEGEAEDNTEVEISNETEEEEAVDEDAEQAAALLAAERKAKVQSLLNGKGKTTTNKK